MQISKKCEYALRAVLDLSSRERGRVFKIHAIAAAQNIPPRFLEAILNDLRQAGFVESKRGNDGGYMLARDPANITVGEVIRHVQGPIGVVQPKSNGPSSGYFYGDFAFEELWKSISDDISTICDNMTFAQLLAQEEHQRQNAGPNYTI